MNNDTSKSIIEYLLDDKECEKYRISPVEPYSHTTYRLNNLISYMQLVNSIGNIKRKYEKYLDYEICYRGMENYTWKLEPSIQFNHLISEEREMYREFLQLHPMEFDNIKSPLDKLAKMQHYGLPTRLLDFTKNPLVALFFACYTSDEKNKDKDARVVIYITDEVDNYAGEIISDFIICEDKQNNLKRRASNIEIVKPSYITQRERVQQSIFMIFNNQLVDTNYTNFVAKIDGEFMTSNFSSIIIDSGSKEDILCDLNNIGINIMTLFPELEYTGKYLKETNKNRVDMTIKKYDEFIKKSEKVGNKIEKELYIELKNNLLGENT